MRQIKRHIFSRKTVKNHTNTRSERDTFGPIDVPADRLWGAQTQRSLQNFDISGEQQPREIIRALAQVKRASTGNTV